MTLAGPDCEPGGGAGPPARTGPSGARPRWWRRASRRKGAAPAAPWWRRAGRAGRRQARPALTAVAGGLALAAAFPPAGLWPLAPLGPALLALALWRRGAGAAFGLGTLFGLAFYLPLVSWLVNVAGYVWIALAVAAAVVFGVLCVAQALALRSRAWPVTVAGWWVAAEAVRDRWPYAFPWGRLAMSQAGAPAARWAAAGGPPLLGFLIALSGTTLAWAVLTWRQPARARAVAWLTFAMVTGLTLAGAALPLDPAPARPVTATVAAVQGDVPHARSLPGLLRATTVTANHAAATLALARQAASGARPRPSLVIWPENATDLDPRQYPFVFAAIASAVAAIDRPVLVGEVLNDPRRNVGQLWLPQSGPGPLYVKRQLVPFGEYIPFRGLLSRVTSLTALQPTDFTAGHRAVIFHVGPIKLGDVICYEVGFDGLVGSEVSAGANLLSVQTNDASFEVDGQRGETSQQLAMARIRAVEYDRAVVVASTTGVSAIIAPDGRLIAHSGTWRRAVLEARVPLLGYRTLASRLGGWPEAAIVTLTLLGLAATAARQARHRPSRRRMRPATR